jgi:hypothetical protein
MAHGIFMRGLLLLGLLSCCQNCIEAGISPAKITSKRASKKAQLVNFFAGGLAGTISSTLTIPLEVVKTQLQSSRLAGKSSARAVINTIMEKEGAQGFFKGLTPMLVGIIPTRAIYFWAYSTSKTSLHPQFGDTSWNHLFSAFAAGITSNTVRYA